jgi:hypothetical protein
MSSATPSLVLAGRLETIPLTDIVQILSAARRDGVLSVEREELSEVGEIELAGGQVVGATIRGAHEQIGQALLRRQLLDPELLGEALRQQSLARAFRPIEVVLLEMGLVDPGQLAEVMIEEIEQRVARILSWSRGVFRFRLAKDGVNRATNGAFGVALEPHALLLEAARRCDEAACSH